MCAMVAYFGGKSSSVFQEFINKQIPKDGSIKTYLEPFAGSMGTFMDDESLDFDTVIYNDKNRHQVNLYRCCAESEKFLTYLESLTKPGGILFTEETEPIKKWNFYKSVYHKYTKNTFLDDLDFELGDFELGAIYAFLITSSFSSVYPRGGGFSGYKKDKDKIKLETLIKKLKNNTYTKKLQSITEFYNIDFEELILKYDSEDTYIYLDPPYFRPDENGEDDAKRLFWYGSDKNGIFGPASHRRLLELLKGTKSRWSLSYYYFPLLEELLPRDKYRWTEKEVFRSSAHGGNNSELKKEMAKGTELLIMNYDENFNKI
jgi:site-specific DNA-adenine methylase